MTETPEAETVETENVTAVSENAEEEAATGLAAVTGLKQTEGTSSSFRITFTKSLDTSLRYDVSYSDSAKGEYYELSKCTNSNNLYYYDMSAAKTYYVKVRTTTQDGSTKGEWCTPIKVVTAPAEKPATVKQTKATTTSATLVWSKVSGASGYVVRYWKDYNSVKTVYTTTNSVTIKKLSKNQKYCYGVSAYRSNGSYKAVSGMEQQAYWAMKVLPSKVTGIECSYFWTNLQSGVLNCDEMYCADGVQYVLYRSTSDGKWKKVATGTDSASHIDVKKLKPNYFYKVKVRGYIEMSNGKRAYGSYGATYFTGDPKTVVVGAVKSSKQNVKWSKITGATSYTVYISTTRGVRGKKVGTTKKNYITATKYGSKKLSSKKTYYYTVVANMKVGSKTYTAADVSQHY